MSFELDTEKTAVTEAVNRHVEAFLVYHCFDSVGAGVLRVKEEITSTLVRLLRDGCMIPIEELPEDTPDDLRKYREVATYIDEEDRRLYHFTYWYQLDTERKMGSFSIDTRYWDKRPLGTQVA